jgi:hypothetical protein
MHANQHGSTDGQATMPDLADHRRGNLERAGQSGVILQIELFKHGIEQVIRVVACLRCLRMFLVHGNLQSAKSF